MGLRSASEHLLQARAALDVAIAELEAASRHLASRKRGRVASSLELLRAEITNIESISESVRQKRDRNQGRKLDGSLHAEENWGDEDDTIAEIFAEAQERFGTGDNSRDSLGEEPPSWHDAVNRIEGR